jgi:hypothetical protein
MVAEWADSGLEHLSIGLDTIRRHQPSEASPNKLD